jgi:3-phosphoshikimate 1-carboxyvinyltransferase
MALKGTHTVPGDKSISHRTVILSSLVGPDHVAEPSRIRGLLNSGDVQSTRACLAQLGVRFEEQTNGDLLVYGRHQLTEADNILDAGNAGTAIRLLSGWLAPQGLYCVLSGDESLRRRPMGRVISPLQQMGARIHGRQADRLAPITILPQAQPLSGIHYEMPHASAQVKSAILLAGLWSESPVDVIEPVASRDHTERMLSGLGVVLNTEAEDVRRRVTLPEAGSWRHLKPMDWIVPGDFSSAAFFIVAALLMPGSQLCLQGINLNPTRTGLLDALAQAGARIRIENQREVGGEPMGDIVVEATDLKGDITLSAPQMPSLIDEVPILAMAGVFLDGTLTITGAEELRAKESDRIQALVDNLRPLGVEIEDTPDGFRLVGNPDFHPSRSGVKLTPGLLSARHDHRIAMSLTVLNRVVMSRDPAEPAWPIEGLEWGAISYPTFYEELASLIV